MEGSLGRIVYPDLSARWVEGEMDSVKSSLKQWTLRYGLPVGILLIVVVPLLPILIPVFFGSAYNPMISGTQIMLVGAALSAVFFWLNSFYYAAGKVGLWTKVYGIYAALVIGIAWFCIEQWGFFGMAMVVAVGNVLFTLWMATPVMTSGKFYNESLHVPWSK